MINMQSSLKSDNILNAFCQGVIVTELNSEITFINRAAERILGIKNDEVIGQNVDDLCANEFCENDCPVTKAIESGDNICDFRSAMNDKNGNPVKVILDVSIIQNKKNKPAGALIVFRRLKNKRTGIKQSYFEFNGIVGRSRVMKDLFNLIEEISGSEASVFIYGPTGTGKELIADAVQANSLRNDKPFVKINCSVIPPDLLASELFGHMRGAFTDAKNDRVGRFEMADGGTIFLDEVAEMPLKMQIQLLRILQDGTFERVGESITRQVNVRVIAATNIDIQSAIASGKFRKDLFYRLNVIPIEVPPLKQRMQDVPYLVKYFIDKYAESYKRQIETIDEDALDVLMNYAWPGNVRELENTIEYAIIRSKKEKSICICGLPAMFRENIVCADEDEKTVMVHQLKTEQILELLEKYDWNRSKVARVLGVHRSTIWRRLKSNKNIT